MGKIVVTEFICLDGVFEDPGGAEGYQHGGWTFTFNQGEEGGKFKLDELMAADAQLLGRVTYEGFARAWPAMEDPVGFADKMNGMPKYVMVFPLVLGTGKRLFDGAARTSLELADITRIGPDGVTIQRYTRA
jgi:dihydrofolate reductase